MLTAWSMLKCVRAVAGTGVSADDGWGLTAGDGCWQRLWVDRGCEGGIARAAARGRGWLVRRSWSNCGQFVRNCLLVCNWGSCSLPAATSGSVQAMYVRVGAPCRRCCALMNAGCWSSLVLHGRRKQGIEAWWTQNLLKCVRAVAGTGDKGGRTTVGGGC